MDESDLPITEVDGTLTPPPRKPPTALEAAAPDPSPTDPPKARMPELGGDFVALAFDLLDNVGDAIRRVLTTIVA